MSDAIRCDGCGEFADRPREWGGYMRRGGEKLWEYDNVPDRWVRLVANQFPHDMATVTDCQGEFCGWECAARWFANYAATQRTREESVT